MEGVDCAQEVNSVELRSLKFSVEDNCLSKPTIAITTDRYFTKVGDSLLKYEDDYLAYHDAKERCRVAYGADLVEFRNEREWTEVHPAKFTFPI